MCEGVSDRAPLEPSALSFDTPALSTTSRRLFEDIVCVLELCVDWGRDSHESRSLAKTLSNDLWAPLAVEF